jgi:hypothetical protein
MGNKNEGGGSERERESLYKVNAFSPWVLKRAVNRIIRLIL